MRQLASFLLTLGALAALTASTARAEGWGLDDYLAQRPQSDWAKYGPGTMLHTRMTQTITMPQMPTPQKNVTEVKKTLLGATEDGYRLKVETLQGGTWKTEEVVEPKVKPLTSEVVDAGSGQVTVGGTTYDCVKKKVTWKEDGEVQETSTLWVNDGKGILKMEVEGEAPVTMQVVDLDASVTVGQTVLAGRKMDLTVQTPMGPMTGTMWMSFDVPDNMARQEFSGSQGPVNFQMVNEVVAFDQK